MKPDCRRVLSQIASYSVEELSLDDANAFTRHLDDCPPCKGQWLLFERTLTTLSETPEAQIEVERSRQMWVACVCYAQSKKSSLPGASVQLRGVMSKPSRAEFIGLEGERRRSNRSQNGNPGWLQGLSRAFAPRFGYALAGTAALVLVASLFFSPAVAPAPQVVAALPAVPSLLTKRAAFATPPHATTGMLDYHAATSFEPFSDQVGPTLVSYTATQP
jgi:hypothetical protein